VDTHLIHQTLSKYRILEEIGRGGMGVVYKAHDTVLDRPVAIKVLAPHLTWDQEFVQRFLREARTAARLEHTHIVMIYDVGQAQGYHFIAMKYLEGQPLSTLIRQEGPLHAERAVRILVQIAQALDYAHARGLIHRDVKPGNVIVGPQDQATLTDFGVARSVEGTRLTQSGVTMGTPAYMAPEQVKGEPVGPATDVYALGVVTYEMLGGRAPFEGETPHVLHAHAYEPPPPLRQVNPRVPEALAAAVHKALAKEPKQRYPTAGAFAIALGQAAGVRESEVIQKPPPPRLPSPPPPRAGQLLFWPLFGALGALLLLVVLAFGIGKSISKSEMPGGAGAQTRAAISAPSVPPIITLESIVAPTLIARPTPVSPRPTPIVIVVTATPVSPPAIPTLTQAEREARVAGRLRLRQGNGETIFAYRTERPPHIDGNLSEWRGKSYSVQNPVFKPENWQGWWDLSGVFFIAWDADDLYLGVEVTDDQYVQNESGRTMYKGDDVEIQLDAQLEADFVEDKLNADDHQIGLSAGNFADRPPEAYVWLPSERDGTMIEVAAHRTANGHVLEAAIPWWVLGVQPQPERAYGFALSLSDNDTPGTSAQECMVSTSPNRTTYEHPTLLGNLILMGLE
jgi:serine/threonine protein kinase